MSPQTLLKKKNYEGFITNLVRGDTHLFRNLYMRLADGSVKDVLRDGEVSCAAVVSGVLFFCRDIVGQLLTHPHATVNSTIKDLQKNGWHDVSTGLSDKSWPVLKPLVENKFGAIIHWAGITFNDGAIHEHIGFYAGGDEAISNSSLTYIPVRHHVTFAEAGQAGFRPIIAIYWHPLLDQE